jgi:hypothetical protein
MKVCGRCKVNKDNTEFYRRTKGGYLQSDCKLCETFKHHCRYWAAKELVFLALGDKCQKCGFADKRALQIDHIVGDGAKMRKEGKTIASLQDLKYVATHLKQFQILCANCNWIKRSENKEGNVWNLSELPLNLRMEASKIASIYAVKNITGFIPESRLSQLAALPAGLSTTLDS